MCERMRYQEYNPPAELASWIKLFWIFESRSNEIVPEAVVADGFPELIIHFRTPFAEVGAAGHSVKQPVAIACGQLTQPLLLRRSLDAGMIGIRFQPSGLSPFLSTSMQSLTDARVPAEDLITGIDQLVDDVRACSNDTQRIAVCSQFLYRSIDFDHDNLSVRRALEKIMLTRGRISVEALATHMGRSRRSAELAFQKEVGTSPKMYCRIARFRHAYDAMLENGLAVNWLRIALDSGFFDQSHLIRDFRRFTNESPTSLLAERTSFVSSVN